MNRSGKVTYCVGWGYGAPRRGVDLVLVCCSSGNALGKLTAWVGPGVLQDAVRVQGLVARAIAVLEIPSWFAPPHRGVDFPIRTPGYDARFNLSRFLGWRVYIQEPMIKRPMAMMHSKAIDMIFHFNATSAVPAFLTPACLADPVAQTIA